MQENFDIFDFELTGEEIDQIAAMDTGAVSSSTTATP